MVTNTITDTTNVVTSNNVLSGVCVDWYENISHRELEELRKQAAKPKVPEIKDVIYNPPATVVHWMDGEKTVIKVQEGDTYDPEKGLLLAFAKRLFGNDNTFNKVMHKWCNVEEINLTLERRRLKKLKKAVNVAMKQAEKSGSIDELSDIVAYQSQFCVGDQVVMYEHVVPANREFEPDIGTIGEVVQTYEDQVFVKWPSGSLARPDDDNTWWISGKSIRRINK